MLSDEEREALEILKAVGIRCKGINIDEVIINLIEKQSKEIEKLKENNGYHLGFIDGGIAKKYEYQDKIKSKIDYLLKHYDSENFINFEMFIKILQSLLEEE